jgi:hypothetical protein
MGSSNNPHSLSHSVQRVLEHVPSGVSTAQQLLHHRSTSQIRRISPPLRSLFPRGGLEPGAIYECRGQAATSLACAAVAASTHDNAWTCFFNMSSLNMQAVADLGVALHRVVSTSCSERVSSSQHAHVLAALVEGFDCVIARSPQCTPSAARAIAARVQRHGSTVFLLGQHNFRVDAVLAATTTDWSFDDRLAARKIHMAFHDRHQHRTNDTHVFLPDRHGGVSACTA